MERKRFVSRGLSVKCAWIFYQLLVLTIVINRFKHFLTLRLTLYGHDVGASLVRYSIAPCSCSHRLVTRFVAQIRPDHSTIQILHRCLSVGLELSEREREKEE